MESERGKLVHDTVACETIGNSLNRVGIQIKLPVGKTGGDYM